MRESKFAGNWSIIVHRQAHCGTYGIQGMSTVNVKPLLVMASAAVGISLLVTLFVPWLWLQLISQVAIIIGLSSVYLVYFQRNDQPPENKEIAQGNNHLAENSGNNAIATAELSFAISRFKNVLADIVDRLKESVDNSSRVSERAQGIESLLRKWLLQRSKRNKSVKEAGIE